MIALRATDCRGVLLRLWAFGPSGACFWLRFGARFRKPFLKLKSDFSCRFDFKEGGESFSFFGDEASEEVCFSVGAELVELFEGDGLLENDFAGSEGAFLGCGTVAKVVGGVFHDSSLFACGACCEGWE